MRFSADELLVPLIPLFGMPLLTSATRASESESIPAPILSLQIHKCCTVIESAFAQVNRTRMFSVLGRRSLKFCPSSYERPSITNAAITVPRTLAPIYMTLRSGPCSRSISCLVGAPVRHPLRILSQYFLLHPCNLFQEKLHFKLSVAVALES